MDSITVGRGGVTLRYAVKLAQRIEMNRVDMWSMVEALDDPLELMTLSCSTIGECYEGARPTVDRSSASARILAVARALETLVDGGHDRESALCEIKRRAGTHLDPVIVDALLTLIRVEDMALLTGLPGAEAQPSA